MDPSLVNLPRELLTSHLIPKKRALLVHLLELSVSDNPIKVLLPILLCDPEDCKCVANHSLLDLVVQRTICLERWCLVDLQKPGLCIRIDQHVEAKNLKAHVEGAIIRLTRPITVQ